MLRLLVYADPVNVHTSNRKRNTSRNLECTVSYRTGTVAMGLDLCLTSDGRDAGPGSPDDGPES